METQKISHPHEGAYC